MPSTAFTQGGFTRLPDNCVVGECLPSGVFIFAPRRVYICMQSKAATEKV
jgi:hypothetical protein